MKITNEMGVPLLFAPWLLADTYDYVDDPMYISATSLMRPLQETILAPRIEKDPEETTDLSEFIARSLGNSVHNAVETVWKDPVLLKKSLSLLGFSDENIERIKVNPKTFEDGDYPVYFEQRRTKKLLGYTIGGKFDAVIDGIVHDIKTTSAYAWVNNSRDNDYRIQGSIYRWLNQDIITEDFIRVCFLFTDWQKSRADASPDYPDNRVKYKDIPLMSIEETENWIRKRLTIIRDNQKTDPIDLPQCSDEEVWLVEPTHRYFSNPTKTGGRATRVFDNYADADAYLKKQGKGVIITTEPIAKRCSKYCSAFELCVQQQSFTHDM